MEFTLTLINNQSILNLKVASANDRGARREAGRLPHSHFTPAQLSGMNDKIRLFLAVNTADNALHSPRALIN